MKGCALAATRRWVLRCQICHLCSQQAHKIAYKSFMPVEFLVFEYKSFMPIVFLVFEFFCIMKLITSVMLTKIHAKLITSVMLTKIHSFYFVAAASTNYSGTGIVPCLRSFDSSRGSSFNVLSRAAGTTDCTTLGRCSFLFFSLINRWVWLFRRRSRLLVIVVTDFLFHSKCVAYLELCRHEPKDC